MNAIQNATNETMVAAPGGLTELIRGNDQWLVERIAPLFHEYSVSLDLSCVQRIDAAGIAALIKLYAQAREEGRHFSVCNASSRVVEILKLVGLEPILIYHDVVLHPHSGCTFQRPAA